MAWPPENTDPTAEMPFYCDGEYGYEVLRVSPEGNVFGQTRWIAEVQHKIWWTGSGYRYVESTALHMTYEELPTGRPFGEIRKVREHIKATNEYIWREYWYDAEAGIWKQIAWLWTIEGLQNIPDPGTQVGGAHVVIERAVPFVWTGIRWERFRHSMLKDDEPLRHLPAGFLRTLNPDARVIYYSPTEIGIEPIKGGSGKVLVNLEYVLATREGSVSPNLAVLDWNDETRTIVARYIEPGTEYWIYLANADNAFVIQGLPGDAQHNAAPAWDYRNRLFLSTTPDVNGYLADSGSGQNARLVGKIETDNTAAADGGPYFLRELDISLISRQVSLPETYREFSDFVVTFWDQQTLRLERLDATYGQIFAGGNLHFLGEGRVLQTDDPWIEWSDTEPKLVRRTNALSPSSQYFLYLSGEVDPFNFNAINPDTNRPWQATDTGAVEYYDPDLDLRLMLFLSPKEPDHGVLDEAWPGYYARHVGQVRTDEYGNFVNAWDLSAIRQKTLNPSWFDGLAEIELVPVDTTEFRVCRKKGSSGIISVRGAAVQTFDSEDPDVHWVTTADLVQAYNEGNPSNPLSPLNPISWYPGEALYLYMANHRSLWGSLPDRTFVSNHAPTGGYLSQNWPGNNARWICTVKPDGNGAFTGKFIPETIAVSAHSQIFDDEPEKHRVHNDVQVTNLNLLSAAGVLFELQKQQGLPVQLDFQDATHVKLVPIGDQATVVILPDLTVLNVPAAGISLAVAGNTGTMYFVYATASGPEFSSAAPDKHYAALETRGTTKTLVGWFAFAAPNQLQGAWNVWSHSHEDRKFTATITTETTTLNLPGCVVPPGRTCELTRTGQSSASCDEIWSQYGWERSINISVATGFGRIAAPQTTFIGHATLSHGTVQPGIYSEFSLTHSLSVEGGVGGVETGWHGVCGELILTRH
jgi:hypothetical protein